MTLEELINIAIREGSRYGVGALSPQKRAVFLISEAEVLCDMEGIDSFLERYSPIWMVETAKAFRALGATEIADGIYAIATAHEPAESLLERVNSLITGRVGCEYENFRKLFEMVGE